VVNFELHAKTKSMTRYHVQICSFERIIHVHHRRGRDVVIGIWLRMTASTDFLSASFECYVTIYPSKSEGK